MKYCVIDIGSNSVRLMLNENGVTVYKKVKMTRLAENLGKERFLCSEAISRTLNAIKEFYFDAKNENPLKIYIFAKGVFHYGIQSISKRDRASVARLDPHLPRYQKGDP